MSSALRAPVVQRISMQRGLSLIELIFFIVIVSFFVAGILSVLTQTVYKSSDPIVRKQALAVAEGMMDEILAKDFVNPTGGFTPASPGNPTTGERQHFDDVDDFNGWNQTAAGVHQQDGTLVTMTGTYTVAVTVGAATLSGVAAKQVTVTVTSGSETISLIGYRTSYE